MWLFFKREILWFLQVNQLKIVGLGMLLILTVIVDVLNTKNGSGTIADVFLGFLQQENGQGNPITSNLNWIIIQSLPVFLFGSYFYTELFMLEEFVTIRFNNRKLAYLSKFLLIITVMLVYYLTFVGLVILVSFLYGITFNLQPVLLYEGLNLSLFQIGFCFLVGGIVLICIQLLLSVIIKPFFAIMVALVMIIINCFVTNYWIIGSTSNIAKFVDVNNWLVISIPFMYLLLATIMGVIIYQKTDLYKLN